MDPVFHAAAEANQLGWLMGFTTLLFMGSFGVWVWWAFAPAHRAFLEEASRLPFDDDPGDPR